MFKERLLTPGPTMIPSRVMEAMNVPMLHHRSEVFKKELRKACEGVRWALGWGSDPIFLACSGTGALEASVLNTCKPGDSIIYVNGGVFGARWGAIAERLQLTAHEIPVEWGAGVTIEQAIAACKAFPNAKAFCLQHSETSTTVLHPLDAVLPAIKDAAPQMLTIVDAISSSVTTPPPGKPGMIDIYVAGSQKAYMLPPGLSFLLLSDSAWKVVYETPKRSLYFDLELERKSLQSGETSWTPASTLIVGLNAAIELLREEGLENVYLRHALLSRMTRKGLSVLGCSILALEHPCPSVTGFFPPDGIDADTLRTEVRKRFGFRFAGGQGKWKGKVVRIGHMGFVDPFEILSAVSAVGLTLRGLGLKSDHLNATAAALEEMSNDA
jgi:aspartate aminotransferase-like enzyme